VKDKETEITIETFEVLVISRRGSLSRKWCEGCGMQVATISLDDACKSGLNIEAVQRQLEAGRIHSIERLAGRH
jgi:hypothetical protein